MKDNVILVGFAATGKTCVGRRLNQKLSRESVDIDQCVEEMAGKPIPEIIAQNFDVAYVARGSLHSAKEINKTKKYVRNAIEAQLNGEGFSLVEVLAQCPTNWRVSTGNANEWLKDKVVPVYPLGEFKKREGHDDK